MSASVRGLLVAAAVCASVVSGAVVVHAQSSRAWMGVYTQSLNGDLREGLDLDTDAGVIVTSVVDDSPADRAGVRKGDVIVTYNSRSVESPDELADLVRDSGVGQSVVLSVLRDGERRRIEVRLGDRPNEARAPRAPVPPTPPTAPRLQVERDGDRVRVYSNDDRDDGDSPEPRVRVFEKRGHGSSPRVLTRSFTTGGRGRLGVRIESLTPELAEAVGSSATRGVLVLQVLDDTPAERAGLKAGDIITSVDGKSITDAEDLMKTLADADSRVSLRVERRGTTRTIETELAKADETWRSWNGFDGQRGMKSFDLPELLKHAQGLDKLEGLDGMTNPKVKIYRHDAGEDTSEDALREEIRELREQLRELRREMRDMKR